MDHVEEEDQRMIPEVKTESQKEKNQKESDTEKSGKNEKIPMTAYADEKKLS